jgi:hypothetical protein
VAIGECDEEFGGFILRLSTSLGFVVSDPFNAEEALEFSSLLVRDELMPFAVLFSARTGELDE